MKLKTKLLFAALPAVILLMMTVAPTVKAWDGPWSGGDCGWNGCGNYGPSGCGFNCGDNGPGLCGGYCAGEQDAVYDLQNNLAYQPYGSCLPCHSQEYWDNFHQGYDSYWNSHQEQNQGASININGDNNYVLVNQYQQQNPLQQLVRAACGIVNCNQPTAYGGP